MSEPIVRLTGKKVDLCILMTDPEFVELYTKWYNDETSGMWVHGNDGVHSIAESQKWADNANKDGHYNFTVCVKRTYKGKVKRLTASVPGIDRMTFCVISLNYRSTYKSQSDYTYRHLPITFLISLISETVDAKASVDTAWAPFLTA